MSNTAPIYTSACRFTDERVQVAHHGHGVRISLEDGDGFVSRFLEEGQANTLVNALVNAGFGPVREPDREDRQEAQISTLGRRLDSIDRAVAHLASHMGKDVGTLQGRVDSLERAHAALFTQ
jgi:hypothetical protein